MTWPNSGNVPVPADALGPAAAPPVIELVDAALTYPGPPPVEALRPCSLRVEHGEYVTIVGPSGSGKSTFLNVIGLLDRLTEGSYRLAGTATETLGQADRAALRAAHLGFVFQAYHLLGHRTAVENVEVAMLYTGVPRRERRTRASEALQRVGLAPRRDALAARLSGGEKQRVALARALATRPSLLLCDEPTGNLDTASASGVLALLDQVHEAGTTILVITHDSDVASRGHRTLHIVDGVLGEGVLGEGVLDEGVLSEPARVAT